jgi:hypothetical protein
MAFNPTSIVQIRLVPQGFEGLLRLVRLSACTKRTAEHSWQACLPNQAMAFGHREYAEERGRRWPTGSLIAKFDAMKSWCKFALGAHFQNGVIGAEPSVRGCDNRVASNRGNR